MEGVAKIPPNHLSSGPLFQSDPLTHHLRMSSSCDEGGKSANARSRRVQGVSGQTSKTQEPKDRVAAQRTPRQNTSPTKRERETSMVSPSLTIKLTRVDATHTCQTQRKTTSDFSLVSGYQTKHKDKKCRMNRAVASSTQHVDDPTGGKSALDPDANQADMNMDKDEESGAGHVPQSPTPARGWVGPLFQSFKSKMASFTEIVMSPVKLFKPNDVPPSSTAPDSHEHLDADRVQNSERSERKETFDLNNRLGKVDGNADEGCEAGTDPGLSQSRALDGEEAAGDICMSLDSNKDGLGDWQEEPSETGGRIVGHSTAVQKHSNCSFNVLKTHSLPEEDKCTFEGRQTSDAMLASDEQNDTVLLTMTEKETNNNTSVPYVLRSQSSVTSSFEQSHESTPFSSSSSPPNTSASCGSELNPNIETEDEPVGLTGGQWRPLRRKRIGRNKSKSKSRSSEAPLSPEISCKCTTASVALSSADTDISTDVGISEPSGKLLALKCTQMNICRSSDNDTSSTLSSAGYYTPPDSLCLPVDNGGDDSGLHKNNGIWVCSSHVSVRKRSRKAVTVNDTAPKAGASSEFLQKQLVENEGKQAAVSTKRKRNLKATALLVVERDSEKRKRGIRRGEKLEEGEEESVSHAGFESTLALLEHKEHTEPVRPRMSSKRESAKSQCLQNLKLPTQSYSSTVGDVKAVQEPVETSPPVIKGLRGSGSGRKGRGGKNAPRTVTETSSAIEPGDPTVNHSTGSLSEGNSRGMRKRNKITDGQDCFSSTKRLKEKNGTCSHSESDSNATGDMDLETTMTTSMVKASLEEQVPGGVVQHLNTKGLPRTSKIQKKGALKKRKVDDVGPCQNLRKCLRSMPPDLSLVDDAASMSSPSGACTEQSVQLIKHEVNNQGNGGSEEKFEEAFSNYGQSKTVDEVTEEQRGEEETCTEIRRCTRELRRKPRKAENQKRRRKALPSSQVQGEEEQEEEKHTAPNEQVDFARVDSSDGHIPAGHLQRSYSCPEMPSLRHHDSPWGTSLLSPHRGRARRRQSSFVPPAAHLPESFRRARRHTVCSLEVEREIAPLCLRKEVYPTRRSGPHRGKADHLSPGVPPSPSSFSAQASCFLSSPLAFLSKKVDKRSVAGGGRASCSSPSVPPSSSSPSCSSVWPPFPGSHPCSLPGSDISSASVNSLCSALSQIPLEGESETRQQSEEEEDGEDARCQEFESVMIREEKSLSDSEIKMGSSKHEERGKVSSIRIRRALPKPQNNLTPMGLPKAVRLKKKEFSLEEIYTNKNFTKPPEGRLETIFEVPRNRRNGSPSHIGLKRMKRYVEFPEVGVARKPRKSLVGAGKAFGRPRRGGYPNSKDDPSVSSEELDSLLCSKLEQLDCWLAFDQETS